MGNQNRKVNQISLSKQLKTRKAVFTVFLNFIFYLFKGKGFNLQ
jgi:hypothetical protein